MDSRCGTKLHPSASVEVLLQSKPRVSELGFPILLCRRVRLVLLQSKPRLCELGSC